MFSNHFPMALVTLERLQADDATLQSFGSHPKGLKPNTDRVTATLDDRSFAEQLSAGDRHADYFHYFISRLSIDDPLPKFEQLAPSLAASAFHRLIRLACGLEAGSKTEIAARLAIIAGRYLAPFAPQVYPGDARPGQFLQGFDSLMDSHLAGQFPVPDYNLNITGRIKFMADRPAVSTQIDDMLSRGVPELAEITRAGLKLFSATTNFTALHTVTACHAARIVSGYLPDTLSLRYTLAADILLAGLKILVAEFGGRSFPGFQGRDEQPLPCRAKKTLGRECSLQKREFTGFPGPSATRGFRMP